MYFEEVEEVFLEESKWVLMFVDEYMLVDELISDILLFLKYLVGESVNLEIFEEIVDVISDEN